MHRKKKRNRKKEIEKDGNDDDQDDDEELERNRNTTPMAIGVLLGAPKTERLGSLGLWSLSLWCSGLCLRLSLVDHCLVASSFLYRKSC